MIFLVFYYINVLKSPEITLKFTYYSFSYFKTKIIFKLYQKQSIFKPTAIPISHNIKSECFLNTFHAPSWTSHRYNLCIISYKYLCKNIIFSCRLTCVYATWTKSAPVLLLVTRTPESIQTYFKHKKIHVYYKIINNI